MLKVNTWDWLSFTVATARERSLSPCSQPVNGACPPVQCDGKQKYKTKYYNLDAIISVGYRVNS